MVEYWNVEDPVFSGVGFFGGSFPFLDSPVNPPPADHLPRTPVCRQAGNIPRFQFKVTLEEKIRFRRFAQE